MGIEGDPRFLFPSSVVQSDDFRITNLLSDILYGISNEREKIRIIHDYLVQNTAYDMDSVNGERKPQDALSVLGTRYHFDPQYEPAGHHFAVCEGYSNAAAALLRAAGIETQHISSPLMNHAWNLVYTGGSWKFLDVTWDDPLKAGTDFDFGPSYVRYDYFLLGTQDGKNGDHYGGIADITRSVIPVPVIPKMKGMPDGWY
jgi:transglutaminase/protease-like cytokinesis protein 3